VSLPRFRGDVENVEQAMWARLVLHITCQRCSRPHSEWAYRLCERESQAKPVLLNRTVPGFFCRGCNCSVSVYISARPEGDL